MFRVGTAQENGMRLMPRPYDSRCNSPQAETVKKNSPIKEREFFHINL